MIEYALVYRTPDNSDGVYDRRGNQAVSLRQLERRGYSLRHLLGCTGKRLAQIVEREQER